MGLPYFRRRKHEVRKKATAKILHYNYEMIYAFAAQQKQVKLMLLSMSHLGTASRPHH